MPTNVRPSRRSQIVAWVVSSLFILGFFFSQVGAWTGPIMGAWFVGTQKPRRGFLWMVALGFIPGLIFGWRKFPLTGPQQALAYLGWTLVAAVLGALPFTFHRLTSPRLPGFLSTLPLPLAGVAIPSLALALNIGAPSTNGLTTFLTLWFAATVVWLWNHESRATIFVFGAGLVLAAGVELSRPFSVAALQSAPLFGTIFGSICLGGALLLSVWALFHPLKNKSWASRTETVALLESPFTHGPLHVVTDQGRETLVSSSGERFPIRNGIPTFLKPEDLTGDNGKYNHLYETIGGFYDDIQRVIGRLPRPGAGLVFRELYEFARCQTRRFRAGDLVSAPP